MARKYSNSSRASHRRMDEVLDKVNASLGNPGIIPRSETAAYLAQHPEDYAKIQGSALVYDVHPMIMNHCIENTIRQRKTVGRGRDAQRHAYDQALADCARKFPI